MKDKFEERDKQFEEICKILKEQFAKKNRDYGDSYFSKDGSVGYPVDRILSSVDFYVQIKRKVSRLASFAEKRLKGKAKEILVNDETEEDTIKDLAIYAIMELMLRDIK